jgi:ferric-dicitrate binding protein FerR (iron transport regulator)
LSHETDDSETALLQMWLKSDSKNQKIFDKYKKTFELTKNYTNSEVSALEIEREWDIIASRINFSSFQDFGGKTTHRKSYILYAAAAMLALVMLVGGGLLYLDSTMSTNLTAEESVLKTNLSDGSQVALNIHSTLEYSKGFNKKQREVKLSGDAYFEVSHNVKKPFVVKTSLVSIEVIGTKFYAEERDSGVFVAVSEGKVRVYDSSNPQKELILNPNENTFFNPKEKNPEKNIGNNPNLISWSNRQLNFENVPLSIVVKDLERTYHVKIVLKNTEIGKCRLNVSFNDESLDSVLKIIETTLNLRIIKSANTYEIVGI